MKAKSTALLFAASLLLATSIFAAPPPNVRPAVGRKAFLRCEENAKLPYEIVCDKKGDPITNAVFVVRQFVDNTQIRHFTMDVPEVAPGKTVTLEVPVETRIRPGETLVTCALETRAGARLYWCPSPCWLTITKLMGDHWDIRLWYAHTYFDKFADIGFTGGCGGQVMRWTNYERNLKPTQSEREKAFAELDHALKSGMTYGFFLPFMYPVGKDKKQYYRLNRQGGVARDNVYSGPHPEVSNPEMQDFAREEAQFFIREFGSHPANKCVLFCSEMRDASFASFNTEHKRFKKDTGLDVPELIGTTNWNDRLAWAKARFAATKGIVPEDDPYYVYETWRLGGGDGWPAFLSAAYDEYHRGMKDPEFDTFWDPAVRWAPSWTSGGSCKTLGHWVYGVPDPLQVGGPAEELLAMARGRQPAQRTIPMIQLICYRRSIAPVGETVKNEPKWFKTHRKAAFLTIPPDALQEATWVDIAKPSDGIAYYGHETVIETGTDWYACTAPESREMLKGLCWNLLRPLGPTLKLLGRKPPKVAVLESRTSVIFGGHHQYGWSSEYVMHAQRARLDPRVIYEEEVLRDGLDGIDVIYAPCFHFTTQKVKDKLDAFRKRGGLLVLDGNRLAAMEPDVISPDGVIWEVPKIDQPEGIEEAAAAVSADNAETQLKTVRNKNMRLKNAQILRDGLAAKGYRPENDSSSPEIVIFARQHGDIPYLFAINDKRTFGDYVGQWGHMMEKGLPFAGEVMQKDPGFRDLAVYELSKGGLVPFARKDGKVVIPVKYTTNDGRLFVFAEEKIGKVEVVGQVKSEGDRKILNVAVKVLGVSGRPMKGLWPVEVTVTDAAGNKIDGIDYGCAADGVFTTSVPLNLDDAKGDYAIAVRDRASGLTATAACR